MILAAVLAAPAVAQPVPGAVKVSFASDGAAPIPVGSLDERTPAAPCLELANWTPKVIVRVLPERGDG